MTAVRLPGTDEAGSLTNRVFLDEPHLARLLGVLDRDGESARVVGGAVRNAALGVAPGDIDVTTTALPEAVIARARAAGFRTVPTGLAHGTVTVVVAGRPFEVTTLREDVETDGRHATVRFGRDYAQDALRRDFTINALSVDAAGHIHDYAGGLDDLAAGRVRFIGAAEARIREDYLRILRFFRFSASYAAGPLDLEGVAACKAAAGGLAGLSRERIRAELLKLIVAPRAGDVLAVMADAGLLTPLLGGTARPARFARLRAIENARSASPDALLGLAALAGESEVDVARLRDALRLSNDERDRLYGMIAALGAEAPGAKPPDAQGLSALLYNNGRAAALDGLALRHADAPVPPEAPDWLAAGRFLALAVVPALPVSGADVVARGIRSGPLVGQVLKQLQALWIRAGFPEQPTVLHDLLDRAIQAVRRENEVG